jgi:hypothetical protein
MTSVKGWDWSRLLNDFPANSTAIGSTLSALLSWGLPKSFSVASDRSSGVRRSPRLIIHSLEDLLKLTSPYTHIPAIEQRKTSSILQQLRKRHVLCIRLPAKSVSLQLTHSHPSTHMPTIPIHVSTTPTTCSLHHNFASKAISSLCSQLTSSSPHSSTLIAFHVSALAASIFILTSMSRSLTLWCCTIGTVPPRVSVLQNARAASNAARMTPTHIAPTMAADMPNVFSTTCAPWPGGARRFVCGTRRLVKRVCGPLTHLWPPRSGSNRTW